MAWVWAGHLVCQVPYLPSDPIQYVSDPCMPDTHPSKPNPYLPGRTVGCSCTRCTDNLLLGISIGFTLALILGLLHVCLGTPIPW